MEITIGQKILGCLTVLNAIFSVMDLFNTFSTGGAWGLIYVPLILSSFFAAYKYFLWFRDDNKETRKDLIMAWTVKMIGWLITYLLCCIFVVVVVPGVKD